MIFKFIYLLFSIIQIESSLDIFYPFGQNNGDNLMFKNDDGFFGPFKIPLSFPYFNRKFSSCFVNTNGLISFDKGIFAYTPIPFPLNDTIGVAPFWNDIDTTNGGDIFFRQITDSSTLNQIGSDIRNSFSGFVNFRPSWALLVTWFEVAQFSQSEDFPHNTFQALITTNGRHSFTVFNYHKLEWSRSENINQDAQVGFNAGDGVIYYALNESFTPNVTDIVFGSNVQRPGRWIFRIDDYSIQEGGCNTEGYVTLNPFVVYFIGGEDVLVSGPCFNIGQDTAKVLIDSHYETECYLLDSNSCRFKTPLIKKIGRVSVILNVYSTHSNNTFQANLFAKDQSLKPKITGLNYYFNRDTDFDINLNIVWNKVETVNSYNIYVMRIFNNGTETKQIQADIQQNSTSFISSLLFFDNFTSNIEINYLIIATFNQRTSSISYLFILNYFLLNPSSRVENYMPRFNFGSDFLCESWATSQEDPTPYLQGLPPCWPTLPSGINGNIPERFGDFIQDKACNPSRPTGCSSFHPGAKVCYRSQSSFTFNSNSAGQQCCYNNENNLMVGPPGGGTLDLAHSDNPIDHFFKDVVPYFICCKISNNCEKYYEKRPSDDASRWMPPAAAGGSGDPHFTTFDGVEYTFNGFGEYTLFEISQINFTCQIRTSPLSQMTQDGTVFKALAIKSDNSTDQVQIELDASNNLLVYVNGIITDIYDDEINLNKVSLKIINGSKIELIYSEGINFQIILTPQKNAFLIFSSVDLKFKGQTRGMLGNCNGIKSDDFILPNGVVLNLNQENDRDIFEQFGQQWLVNDQSSIFTYQEGLQASDYFNIGYTPKFIQDGIFFTNSSLEQVAREKCGNNKKCLYDISVTSDIEIGILSLDFDNKIQVFKQDLENLIQNLVNNDQSTAINILQPNNIRNKAFNEHTNKIFLLINLILCLII